MVEMDYGCFVISLDFELMWGNVESWTVDGYGKSNVAQVRTVIDSLLRLFDKYHVSATFATVGLIMQDKTDSKKDMEPDLLPTYKNRYMSPFENEYIYNIVDKYKNLYFGLDVIEKLKTRSNIEIGTHTYSHYYCNECGQNILQFEADIKMAVEVASRNGIELKSIVFPRNQVSKKYLEVCAKYGITSYRGNPQRFFGEEKTNLHRLKNRVCRFVDAYVNISGRTSYCLDRNILGIVNIPASRFLRPYSSKFSILDNFKLNRIENELEYAAKKREVYHLWWHPHNFGKDINKNLDFLEKVLNYYKKMHDKYGMQSMTMKDVCNLVLDK